MSAYGQQLIEIHRWLREELARLREGVETHLADGTGPRTGDLRAHCLAFCAALTRHHTGEDGGAFRVLAEREPALRPVLAELAADHEVVAGILSRVEELFAADPAADPGATGTPVDPRRVRAELDGLAALLESHLVYEEKKLTAALDALDPSAGTTSELLGLTPVEYAD
ncbi:hemerythrin domain-containing protein [Micromonospora echinofusca]|uniref:Hemerythrin domain-containing protein n=1 Tax=Micromonospora echinofusca TaxID=47858 RepID=A0ABS3VUG6_MICEH|nr:hemerythrin domain-containing protein [Micromonospora echinofusca]